MRHLLMGDIGNVEALACHQALVLDPSLELTPLAHASSRSGLTGTDRVGPGVGLG